MSTPKKKVSAVKKTEKSIKTKKTTIPVATIKAATVKKTKAVVVKKSPDIKTSDLKKAITVAEYLKSQKKTKKENNHLILDLSPKAKKARKTKVKTEKVPDVETQLVTQLESGTIKPVEDLLAKYPHLFTPTEALPDEPKEETYKELGLLPEHGSTETIIYGVDATDEINKVLSQSMIIEPDSIGFKDEDGVFKFPNDEKEGEVKEEELEDYFLATYDMHEAMSEVTSNVDRKMFLAFMVAFAVGILAVFYLFTSEPKPSMVVKATDIVVVSDSNKSGYKTDTTSMFIPISVDSNFAPISQDSTKTTISHKESIVPIVFVQKDRSYAEQRKIDSLAIEHNKHATPIYVTTRKK